MTETPTDIRAAADAAVALVGRFKQALARRDRTALNEIIRQLLTEAPILGPHWKSIAATSRELGELEDALNAMRLYARDFGEDPAVRYEVAAVTAQSGFIERAAAIIDDIPVQIPTPAANAYIRGTLLTNLGKFTAARAVLRDAVRLDPASGQAWLALAMVGNVEPEDSKAIIDALKTMESAADFERAAHCYAVGKVCHERGQFTKAFEFFSRGAALVQRSRPYNFAEDRQSATEAVEGWSSARILEMHTRLAAEARAAGKSPPESSAIFVTGLPRSGTTLVEQILVSHSGVDDGDELGLFRIIEAEVRGRSWSAFSRWLKSGGSVLALAELYNHLVRQRFPGSQKVVDKSLGAGRYLGLLLSMFPDAKVVWVRRDPFDCAWSAYRTWFLRGLSWSWSLESIARHFRLEDELFNFWTRQCADRILVVEYEKLVKSPESEIARLNTFCGLQTEPLQLQPHKKERSVTTASVSQVRQPINPTALGASLPYRQWMDPFARLYQP